MDHDLLLTIGVVLAILTIPSLLSAWTDGRVPRMGAIMALTAGGLILAAANGNASGYELHEVPQVMMNVVARYVN